MIQIGDKEELMRATLVELESTNGKTFLDTRWDKTKRMFRHTLNYNFLQDAFNAYQLVVTYYTMQGYQETKSYTIQADINSAGETTSYNDFCFTSLQAQPIEDKGVVHLTATLRDLRNTPVQELGVLVIERAEDVNAGLPDEVPTTERLKWHTCYERNHRANCTLDKKVSTLNKPVYNEVIEHDDVSAEPGIIYRYRMRFKTWKETTWQYAFCENDDVKANYIETKKPVILFIEDIFLATKDLTLKIKYNPDLTTYKRNVVDTITPTLGGAYPFVRRNGAQIYRTFNLGGLISYNAELYHSNNWSLDSVHSTVKSDNDEFFESLFINQAGKNIIDSSRYNQLIADGVITVEQKRILYERLFRTMVMDFLYDDQVILFKSQPEGNIFVRLSNVQLTPNKQLDRHIYSFSATATEVLEANADNYLKYFSPVATGKEPTAQNIYLIAGYYMYDNGVLFIGETEQEIETQGDYIIAPTWNKDEDYTSIDLHLVTEEKETEWEG